PGASPSSLRARKCASLPPCQTPLCRSVLRQLQGDSNCSWQRYLERTLETKSPAGQSGLRSRSFLRGCSGEAPRPSPSMRKNLIGCGATSRIANTNGGPRSGTAKADNADREASARFTKPDRQCVLLMEVFQTKTVDVRAPQWPFRGRLAASRSRLTKEARR